MAQGNPFETFRRASWPAGSVVLEQLLGAERAAFLREVALMPRDLGVVVPEVRPGDDVVFLVHGFLASGGVFRPLKARLEREAGARVATFTHAPGAGIRRIAQKLRDLVEQMPAGARVTIVGHSLGGIVARWYVQEMGGEARVKRTISLASPFRGVAVPQLLVGVDLCAQSALLRRIREGARASRVPHTSIVAACDTVVADAETACLGVGDVMVVPGCGHNRLLFDESVAGLIIDRVRRCRPGGGQSPQDKGSDSAPRPW